MVVVRMGRRLLSSDWSIWISRKLLNRKDVPSRPKEKVIRLETLKEQESYNIILFTESVKRKLLLTLCF
tara:strand:+ start:107 stop:313 length:207 start_codon:yes stop_codon:yes gene_type:complete